MLKKFEIKKRHKLFTNFSVDIYDLNKFLFNLNYYLINKLRKNIIFLTNHTFLTSPFIIIETT